MIEFDGTQYDIHKGEGIDLFCKGYRFFHNYDKTFNHYKEIVNTNLQQYYGQGVLIFEDVSDINILIQELTVLRDKINIGRQHPKVQIEFGTNKINYNYYNK